MSCYFSHLLAETGSCDFKESLNSGFPLLHSVKALNFAVSNLPQKAEIPKGCLFPDLIPNRDVSQRYLAKLTREGSYSTGGFHCLSLKDRSTWGNVQTVHIYYIHIRTVVREVNKGLKCVNLIWQSLLPLVQDWSLLELSPHLEPTREVLPQTVKNSKWPGVWGLLGLATKLLQLTRCHPARVGPLKKKRAQPKGRIQKTFH